MLESDEPSEPTDDQRHHSERSGSGTDPTAPSDPDAADREARAIEGATAAHLGLGVRLDAHGEVRPDAADGERDADEVIEQHRATAAEIERDRSIYDPNHREEPSCGPS